MLKNDSQNLVSSYDNRSAQRNGLGLHFTTKIFGKTVAYSQISENACTSVQKFIANTSIKKNLRTNFPNDLEFLCAHHCCKDIEKIKKSDIKFFIYRDPIERLISIYKNKFITANRPQHLTETYLSVTGKDPRKASFEDFVSRYIWRHQQHIDPECIPQHLHLHPIIYSHAIELSGLRDAMSSIFCDNLANEYFSTRHTSTNAVRYVGLYAGTPACYLRDNFFREGALPSDDSLKNDKTVSILRKIYRADFEMIEKIKSTDTAHTQAAAYNM